MVTDILFLRKRAPGEAARHADPAWLKTQPLDIEGESIPINGYFHHHPEMVLGTYSRKDRLYDAGYSLISNGDLAEQLRQAIGHLPQGVFSAAVTQKPGGGPGFHATAAACGTS